MYRDFHLVVLRAHSDEISPQEEEYRCDLAEAPTAAAAESCRSEEERVVRIIDCKKVGQERPYDRELLRVLLELADDSRAGSSTIASLIIELLDLALRAGIKLGRELEE